MAVIEVDNVFTRFGEQRIHSGINFKIDAGTLVALIGGSGSGKSVLVKEAIGLLRPTAGSVRSEERRVGKECRSRWSPYH